MSNPKTVVSEPAWFVPEPFCRQVLNYSFRAFEVMQPETAEELNRYSKEFRDAVETVGRAILTLQRYLHDKLRPVFVESVNFISGVQQNEVQGTIIDFMTQGYLCRDIINFVISSLAVLAELIFFMYEFGLPIPNYWFPFPWCGLYEHRFKKELSENGGWPELLRQAPSRFGSDIRLLLETMEDSNPPVVVRSRSPWPEYLPEALLQSFSNSRSVAMELLRAIYRHERFAPEPGKGAHVMRLMLGLNHLNFSEREDRI